ncbi:hypothetical protein Tsubulata_001974 [Turnera subulata]|uniref:DUF4283 domain-containing protein n=1 Tax=Turnera subulata TaxID=218843 RepID=A0A9Q0F9N2_9ROSI|nr:hypothetical protein Tsubulata_001974 [Turnera subulata]
MVASSSRRILDLAGESGGANSVSPEESLGAIVARTYVMGKNIGDRRPHISQIRSQMMNVWYIKGDFRIIPKPNYIFLIGFELEADKKKVLKGTPWLVSSMHFCLKVAHDKIFKIGSVFLVLHFYEPTLEAMLAWQCFIRARIEIATDMPLLPGVACRDSNGNEIWVHFLYERSGEICSRCGNITHPTSRCTKPSKPGEGIEKQAEDSYGPWMRVKELFGKHYPAKKQIPLEEQEEPSVKETPQALDETSVAEPAPNSNADSVGAGKKK